MMVNLEGINNQCEAATIQPDVIVHIGETSGSSPNKDPSPLHNVQGVLPLDGMQYFI